MERSEGGSEKKERQLERERERERGVVAEAVEEGDVSGCVERRRKEHGWSLKSPSIFSNTLNTSFRFLPWSFCERVFDPAFRFGFMHEYGLLAMLQWKPNPSCVLRLLFGLNV
ncbi:hypothetical protein NE237_012012 [Protea cynaroides]|uniref:Uncharacterized protein n=1 Tax=Protea cynaroides TaxID=273540 RepID=A0A9Q0GX68_9MAGN|nr:hypothetical protein NE237_012012 [Protea cynaroides]